MTSRRLGLWMIVVCAAVLPVGAQKNKATSIPSAPTITLAVDASDAPRKIFHALLTIPVTPGKLTLYYPKWIPGEHGPTGPINDLAGLQFSVNGQPLAWQRDADEMCEFHLEVPTNTDTLDVALDLLLPSGGGSSTAQLLDLN